MVNDVRYYFVDEAGDLTLLGRRGKSLVGTEGVSKTFIVGVAQIFDPAALRSDMERLRRELMADPYLCAVPSLQPSRGRTARCFHAKDDCSEVRMAVFKMLATHDIKVMAGIRRKNVLADLSQSAGAKGVKLDPNSVYDNIVKTLFKSLLHKAEQNTIYFARRGKSTRQSALQEAINRAQRNFSRDTGIASDKPTEVIPAVPSEIAGLQAVDYFLWALQRLYERGEDRYFNFLSDRYRLIMDFDDKRSGTDYGTWYSDKNPLTKEKMLPTTG
jgi:hypothetical protein